MYKDFKKNESLDTGFVGGSGIVWMFSGIVIGLLVGLGLYYFSNMNTTNNLNKSEMAQTSNQVTTSSSLEQVSHSTAQTPKSKMENISIVDKAERQQAAAEEKKDINFSYYAVLPKTDVPVGSIKAIDVRENAKDSANIVQTSATNKEINTNPDPRATAKGKNKATPKQRKGNYVLQIASFKRKGSANSTVRALAKRGVKVHIQKKKIKGRLWYRISASSLDKLTAYRWKKIAEKMGHKPHITQQRK